MGEGPWVKALVDSYQKKYVGKDVKAVKATEGGQLGIRVGMKLKAARCAGKTVILWFELKPKDAEGTQPRVTTVLKVRLGQGGGQ